LYKKGKFVITSEVESFKGSVSRVRSIEPSCVREALFLQKHVHAVNATDSQSAVMRLGSLARQCVSEGARQKPSLMASISCPWAGGDMIPAILKEAELSI
jgi:hypothetical protein